MAKMLKILLIILIVILLTFALFLMGTWQVLRPKNLTTGRDPSHFGFKFEKVSFNTSDNLKLSGWFIPKVGEEDQERVIILLHGYPTDKSSPLDFVPFLHESYNLFLFDFRYFGESEGKFSSFGHHEQKDLQGAIKFLEEREFKKFGIWGISLGGAVALLSLPKLERVYAVVSDSTFAELESQVESYWQGIPFLKYPLILLSKIAAKVIIGEDIANISPAKALKHSKIPVFIIASEKDELFPPNHFAKIKESLKDNPKASFWQVLDAKHGFIYSLHKEEYEEKVLEFFGKYL